VTPDRYVKIEPIAILETRALPRKDEIITQWKVQWQNLTPDQATWEDKLFIKATFPSFYHKILQEWWPSNSSCGQEQAQGGGSCQVRSTQGVTDNKGQHVDQLNSDKEAQLMAEMEARRSDGESTAKQAPGCH
jgi:hypothetical protein